MDYRKILVALVDEVINNSKTKGQRLTKTQISDMLGFKNRTYLSQLLNGHGTVNEGHILLFRERLKDYLPDIEKVTKDDMLMIQASIQVLLRAVSKIQKELPSGTNPGKYLDELMQEIELTSIEMKDRETS